MTEIKSDRRKKRSNCLIPHSIIDGMKSLSSQQIGRLMMALLLFSRDDVEPDDLTPVERVLYDNYKPFIVEDKRNYAEKCETNSRNRNGQARDSSINERQRPSTTVNRRQRPSTTVTNTIQSNTNQPNSKAKQNKDTSDDLLESQDNGSISPEEDGYTNDPAFRARAREAKLLKKYGPRDAAILLSQLDAKPVKEAFGDTVDAVLDAAEARGSAPGLIGLAINKAVKRSRRGPLESPAAYAITLLEDWAEQGLDSPEAVAEAKGDFSHYAG